MHITFQLTQTYTYLMSSLLLWAFFHSAVVPLNYSLCMQSCVIRWDMSPLTLPRSQTKCQYFAQSAVISMTSSSKVDQCFNNSFTLCPFLQSTSFHAFIHIIRIFFTNLHLLYTIHGHFVVTNAHPCTCLTIFSSLAYIIILYFYLFT